MAFQTIVDPRLHLLALWEVWHMEANQKGNVPSSDQSSWQQLACMTQCMVTRWLFVIVKCPCRLSRHHWHLYICMNLGGVRRIQKNSSEGLIAKISAIHNYLNSLSESIGSQSGDSKTFWSHQNLCLALPWCKQEHGLPATWDKKVMNSVNFGYWLIFL